MRATMTTATTTDFVREHLAEIDTSEFTATLIPEMFRDIDYAALNGVEGVGGVADPGINTEADWDFARYAHDDASA